MGTFSILIPTIVGREQQFQQLTASLRQQDPTVSIMALKDNKELSIGEKRNKLLAACETEYFVMIDDDDSVPAYYLEKVYTALQSKPDCIGYLESVHFNGKERIACHSNRFADWGENKEGYAFVRTIFYKDAMRTDIARQIGFADLRYGEDHDFARRLKASGLLKTEVFINEIMYHYHGVQQSRAQHMKRYGITR